MFPTTAPPQVGRDMAEVVSLQRVCGFQLGDRRLFRLDSMKNPAVSRSAATNSVHFLAGLRWSSIHLLSLSRDLTVLVAGGVTRRTSCQLITGLVHRDKELFTAKVKLESPICLFTVSLGPWGTAHTSQGRTYKRAIGILSLSVCTSMEGNQFTRGLLQDVNICPHRSRCITLHTSGQTGTAPAIWYRQAMVS